MSAAPSHIELDNLYRGPNFPPSSAFSSDYSEPEAGCLTHLMCTRHKRETVVVVECLTDVLSEGVSCTSRRDTPSAAVIRVGPQQITHWTFVRHLLDTVDGADVVQRVDGWRQTTVQAEDLEDRVAKRAGRAEQ